MIIVQTGLELTNDDNNDNNQGKELLVSRAQLLGLTVEL